MDNRPLFPRMAPKGQDSWRGRRAADHDSCGNSCRQLDECPLHSRNRPPPWRFAAGREDGMSPISLDVGRALAVYDRRPWCGLNASHRLQLRTSKSNPTMGKSIGWVQ